MSIAYTWGGKPFLVISTFCYKANKGCKNCLCAPHKKMEWLCERAYDFCYEAETAEAINMKFDQ